MSGHEQTGGGWDPVAGCYYVQCECGARFVGRGRLAALVAHCNHTGTR